MVSGLAQRSAPADAGLDDPVGIGVTLRALLPDFCRFSAGRVETGYALTMTERRSLGAADERRHAEFASGRHHLRQALAALGCGATDLVRGPDGAPVLPCDVVASLTHVRGPFGTFVAAVAASRDEADGVGIDVEEVAAVTPDLWLRFLAPDEWQAAARVPAGERRGHVARAWCAKEAAFKAWRRRGALHDIHVVFGDRATGAFAAESQGARVEGRSATVGPLALAACAAFGPAARSAPTFR